MPAFVNMAAIGSVRSASDGLGPLDSVAHPLQPGAYRGETWLGDVRLGTFALEVADQGDGEQIEVDLCSVSEREAAAAAFRSGPVQGTPVYAVFHCDHGNTGLYVIVRDKSGRGVVFDSRKLQPGDYYIVTPVRPGVWTLATNKKAAGELEVQPPTPAKAPRASAAGAMIKVDDKAFSPPRAQIVAGDGIAFEVGGKDLAIRLDLKQRAGAFAKGRRRVGIRYPGRSTFDDKPPPKAAA